MHLGPIKLCDSHILFSGTYMHFNQSCVRKYVATTPLLWILKLKTEIRKGWYRSLGYVYVYKESKVQPIVVYIQRISLTIIIKAKHKKKRWTLINLLVLIGQIFNIFVNLIFFLDACFVSSVTNSFKRSTVMVSAVAITIWGGPPNK